MNVVYLRCCFYQIRNSNKTSGTHDYFLCSECKREWLYINYVTGLSVRV